MGCGSNSHVDFKYDRFLLLVLLLFFFTVFLFKNLRLLLIKPFARWTLPNKIVKQTNWEKNEKETKRNEIINWIHKNENEIYVELGRGDKRKHNTHTTHTWSPKIRTDKIDNNDSGNRFFWSCCSHVVYAGLQSEYVVQIQSGIERGQRRDVKMKASRYISIVCMTTALTTSYHYRISLKTFKICARCSCCVSVCLHCSFYSAGSIFMYLLFSLICSLSCIEGHRPNHCRHDEKKKSHNNDSTNKHDSSKLLPSVPCESSQGGGLRIFLDFHKSNSKLISSSVNLTLSKKILLDDFRISCSGDGMAAPLLTGIVAIPIAH